MKSECIEKIKHDVPECGSHALQIFKNEDGSYTGFCFSCNTLVGDPYGDKPAGYKPVKVGKSLEEVQAEINAITEYQAHSLPDRHLHKKTLEYFGVKVGVSEEDGITPASHYYPQTDSHGQLVGYKVRIIEGKRMWSILTAKDDVMPFGWDKAQHADGKRIYITEGEVDAMSLFQELKIRNKGTEWADLNPAVISLPKGAASAKRDLAKLARNIRKFEDIVLVFDMDEPGRKAVKDVLDLFPNALDVELPEKDFNACVDAGKTKAALKAILFKAEAPKNTRIVQASQSLHEEAAVPPVWGLAWPAWGGGLNDVTRGIRTGETYYIGAAQKMGKSEVVNSLAAHVIKEFGWKVFMAKPEEANKKTYKLVLGKIAKKKFDDPKVEFDREAYDEAGEIVKDKLYMLNLYQNISWKTLQADIREAAAMGCKAIFIDPITNLTNGMSAADANTELQAIAQGLSALALDLDVVIFIFCHLRNPDAGDSHDRGGKVLSSQFAGSRAMARSCNFMIGLEGNKDPDLPEDQRNMRQLVMLENRETGEVGRWPVYWNKHTTEFEKVEYVN